MSPSKVAYTNTLVFSPRPREGTEHSVYSREQVPSSRRQKNPSQFEAEVSGGFGGRGAKRFGEGVIVTDLVIDLYPTKAEPGETTGLGCWQQLLLLQRTQVWILGLKWWLTTACNSRSRGICHSLVASVGTKHRIHKINNK